MDDTSPGRKNVPIMKGQVYSKRLNAQAANNESSYLDKRTMDRNEQRQTKPGQQRRKDSMLSTNSSTPTTCFALHEPSFCLQCMLVWLAAIEAESAITKSPYSLRILFIL